MYNDNVKVSQPKVTIPSARQTNAQSANRIFRSIQLPPDCEIKYVEYNRDYYGINFWLIEVRTRIMNNTVFINIQNMFKSRFAVTILHSFHNYNNRMTLHMIKQSKGTSSTTKRCSSTRSDLAPVHQGFGYENFIKATTLEDSQNRSRLAQTKTGLLVQIESSPKLNRCKQSEIQATNTNDVLESPPKESDPGSIPSITSECSVESKTSSTEYTLQQKIHQEYERIEAVVKINEDKTVNDSIINRNQRIIHSQNPTMIEPPLDYHRKVLINLFREHVVYEDTRLLLAYLHDKPPSVQYNRSSSISIMSKLVGKGFPNDVKQIKELYLEYQQNQGFTMESIINDLNSLGSHIRSENLFRYYRNYNAFNNSERQKMQRPAHSENLFSCVTDCFL